MLQKKIYTDHLAARMRSASQDNWAFNDMQDICELAGLWEKWIKTENRAEEESCALQAAKILGVEIRHYIPIEDQIKAALEILGVKGKVKIIPAEYHRYQVELNGKHFGIFDIDRNTFVD